MKLRHWIQRTLTTAGLLLAMSAAPAWADTCGAAGQRACTLGERIPSCDVNLVEGGGQCVRPACGAEGQRPCGPVERLRSPCDRDLGVVAGQGVCAHRPCGRENQAACTVLQRVPSCDINLVEQAGRCLHPQLCGRLGQAACTVGVRIPSCDVNLVERLGVCTKAGSGDTASAPPPSTHAAVPVGSTAGNVPPPSHRADPGSNRAGGAPLPPVPTGHGGTPLPPQTTGNGSTGMPPPVTAQPAGGAQADTDRLGNDIYGFALTQADPAACQATCNAHAQCAAWTYVKPGIKGPAAQCYLKSPAPAPTRNTCCVSGAKAATSRSPSLGR
jgi:hypothetical protein